MKSGKKNNNRGNKNTHSAAVLKKKKRIQKNKRRVHEKEKRAYTNGNEGWKGQTIKNGGGAERCSRLRSIKVSVAREQRAERNSAVQDVVSQPPSVHRKVFYIPGNDCKTVKRRGF